MCVWLAIPIFLCCTEDGKDFTATKTLPRKALFHVFLTKNPFQLKFVLVYVWSTMVRSVMSLRNWKGLNLLALGGPVCTAVAPSGYLLKVLHLRYYKDKQTKTTPKPETK